MNLSAGRARFVGVKQRFPPRALPPSSPEIPALGAPARDSIARGVPVSAHSRACLAPESCPASLLAIGDISVRRNAQTAQHVSPGHPLVRRTFPWGPCATWVIQGAPHSCSSGSTPTSPGAGRTEVRCAGGPGTADGALERGADAAFRTRSMNSRRFASPPMPSLASDSTDS